VGDYRCVVTADLDGAAGAIEILVEVAGVHRRIRSVCEETRPGPRREILGDGHHLLVPAEAFAGMADAEQGDQAVGYPGRIVGPVLLDQPGQGGP